LEAVEAGGIERRRAPDHLLHADVSESLEWRLLADRVLPVAVVDRDAYVGVVLQRRQDLGRGEGAAADAGVIGQVVRTAHPAEVRGYHGRVDHDGRMIPEQL